MKHGKIVSKLLLSDPSIEKLPAKNQYDTTVRSLFICKRGFPKKEYIRCKLIRGQKRIMRQLKQGKIPEKTLNRFDSSKQICRDLWSKLEQCMREAISEIEERIRTEAGPLTDGKCKRKTKSDDDCKSFNGKFCKWYFSHPVIRKLYFYYIELLFSEFQPEILNDKFDFKCCEEEQHQFLCYQKWMLMKKYIDTFLIEDLGLEPWAPENFQIPNLPNILEENLFESISKSIELPDKNDGLEDLNSFEKYSEQETSENEQELQARQESAFKLFKQS
ncbi:unnamed protein product [Blepharisma stoltei]|uniref:Uncharacterized protein n=1 Tax=Blepharisma stoltei TaxID=1481888 RepID=A0AAU9IDE5_9CILI|nr:unnamed protein product [Blepharisma stoltei]